MELFPYLFVVGILHFQRFEGYEAGTDLYREENRDNAAPAFERLEIGVYSEGTSVRPSIQPKSYPAKFVPPYGIPVPVTPFPFKLVSPRVVPVNAPVPPELQKVMNPLPIIPMPRPLPTNHAAAKQWRVWRVSSLYLRPPRVWKQRVYGSWTAGLQERSTLCSNSSKRYNSEIHAIQCHYYRYHHVYRHGIRPLWRNPARFKNLKTSYGFALRTVNGDWVPDPMMNTFYLGQPIHFQAITNLTVPGTKLFIHSCYATASPALNSTPRYTVIENYGCMVDSRHETCSSHFVPPRTNNTINFIVDAFQFNTLSALVNKYYMHCTMVVTSSMVTRSTKSCHYEKNTERWVELEGNHSVCSCCDSVCLEDVTLPTGSVSSDALLVLGKRGDPNAPIQHSGETYDEAKVPEHSDDTENDEGAVEADGDGR
ncbi:zona pellucida sperm-binding protein 3-like [Acipenser oxyrinchus oxyrinchus]|uniref:Zona pellucida sperm-binding protein 3-like n=1 Tax=Acipenser oxyrinchus oxyrinchus TaxID=40147 RepID=A0AAD8CM02_ACIOX|nr:zona pellucida sperm-binding protein 3-like [Acipenser oxyrinchus oxyrinchus]